MARRSNERPGHASGGSPANRTRSTRADAAVSPVIGMILVLGVSVIGISAVLYWGLPAIEDMKANVEVKSVENQVQELNADVRELVAGTAGKTAKRWQPSMNRGQLAVEPTSHRWLIVANKDSGDASAVYNFTAGGWSEATSATLSLYNLGDGAAGNIPGGYGIKAYKLTGGSEDNLTVCQAGTSCTNFDHFDHVVGGWSPGTSQEFYLVANASIDTTPISLRNTTLRIEVWNKTAASAADHEIAAEIWVMDLGSVHYQLATSGGDREVYLHNGAVITVSNGDAVMTTAPPIPAPRTSATVPRIFMRAIHMYGDASYTGNARFDMLLNLYATSPRADYSCRAGSGAQCVTSIQIAVNGPLEDVFMSYFQDEPGYNYEERTAAWGGYSETFVTYPATPAPMAFTFVQSAITTEVG